MTPSGYSSEPQDQTAFTSKKNRAYTLIAPLYDFAVRLLPTWRRWLDQALPQVHGPRVLELSFGTAYLLGRLATRHQVVGLDLNDKFTRLAQAKLTKAGLPSRVVQGNVEHLPFADGTFDTVVNTMAFSGYPNGALALAEILRVIAPGGCLVLIDVGFPADGNKKGLRRTRMWIALGDIVRDMDDLFKRYGLRYTCQEIGGYGSIHLYVARIQDSPR
jgi:ubiquinone/menaquinone biosynthesis C-methylase UbiE